MIFVPPIGLAVRVFANGSRDRGRVIRKTQKWYVMLPCLTLRFFLVFFIKKIFFFLNKKNKIKTEI